MFCPECKAEYRQGFTYCSDCRISLVEILPLSTQQDGPGDETSNVRFLAWALPMVAYSLMFVPEAYPSALDSELFLGLVVLVYTVGSLGGFWMLYQVIRFEKRIAKYIVIAFVPFMFIWYYLGRYRMRQGQDKIPVAQR